MTDAELDKQLRETREFFDRARFNDGFFAGLTIGAIFFMWYAVIDSWGRGLTDLWLASIAIFFATMLVGSIHTRRTNEKIARLGAESDRRSLEILNEAMAVAAERHAMLSGRPGASA